jgi:ferric-dicitrate binding protein FerR (iron transport regulator)
MLGVSARGMNQMDEIICRSIHGRTSASEEAELARWRRSSIQNERYFRDLSRVLRNARAIEEASPVPPAPNGGDLIGAISRKRRVKNTRRGPATLEGWQRGIVYLAAAASLCTGAVGLSELRQGDPAQFGLAPGEIVTGAGETTTIRLGDGTVVRLGPQSRLRVPAGAAREVWMDGRAFFAVAKQDGRPFVVRTHAGEATVLGTRFDLSARKDDLKLLVVDGTVEMVAKGESVAVTANQTARVTQSSAPVREAIDPGELEKELSWLGEFLVFEETPLRTAAHEIEVRYGIPVEVLDERLASETVSGMFTDESLEDVLAVVCRAVYAHCSVQPSRVTISP